MPLTRSNEKFGIAFGMMSGPRTVGDVEEVASANEVNHDLRLCLGYTKQHENSFEARTDR
jgi:hypothetical protein